jgi:hypothetical protein
MMLLASMIVGLQLIAASQVPTLDVHPGCRANSDIVNMSAEQCLSDESAAREGLLKEWGQFGAGDKAMCTDETRTFNPSYVELLTCLETARDAKIPYRPGE